jgi:hypothetical protein
LQFRIWVAIDSCLDRAEKISTGAKMNCSINQFEDVVAKFKYFAESVEVELSSEAENLRQELVVICAELLTAVREEMQANTDSIVR